MVENGLISQVRKLGYPLLETEKEINVNDILSKVVKSDNARLQEGFPVLLINAMKQGGFDYSKILHSLKREKDKKIFVDFILLSLSLYKFENIKFWWAEKLYDKLQHKDQSKLDTYISFFKSYNNFKIGNLTFNPEKIRNLFQTYSNISQSNLNDKNAKHAELSLEYALSYIFSPKQKNLFYKRLNGEKMTKTEREYYSRSVKKRIVALANEELHCLAKKILER